MSWMFAAYAVVWAAFFIYMISLDRKQASLKNDIAELKKRLGA